MARNAKLASIVAVIISTAIVFSPAVLGDGSQDDITVVGISNTDGGVPGCTASDGAIKIYNASTTYEYRVWVRWRAENDSYGPNRCGTGCPPAQEACQCERETLYEIGVNTDIVGSPACLMPSCDQCTSDCDNTIEQSQCSYDHCTGVYGIYRAAYYKEPNDETWTAMTPSFGTAITETERDEDCPGDPESVCDY